MQCGIDTSCYARETPTDVTVEPVINATAKTTSPETLQTSTLAGNSSSSTLLRDLTTVNSALNSTQNTTEPFPEIPNVELSLILTAAILTTMCNLIVLIASKFTSGGKSPTLVFIRSLCVSDSLIGIYGLFKIAMYMCLDKLLVNFFLAESLFFTASFASGLSLLSLNIDSCMKLAEPLNLGHPMDKKNVITVMVMLWNLSFVVGFLPQMGWSQTNGKIHVLRFFVFHPWHYLLFFSLMLIVIFVSNILITMYMRKKITLIQSHRSFLSPNSTKFQKYHTLVITAVIDMVLWVLCYLPFFVYLAVYCDVCYFRDRLVAERYIVYFIPVFLTKSFISGIVHGYRTAQIHEVMTRFSRSFSRIVHSSRKRSRKAVSVISNGQNNNCNDESRVQETHQSNAELTQSTTRSMVSDDIEVISSQMTLYSTVNSTQEVEVITSDLTRL
ncbi:lysophosphatidic acid receptor 1-B-like [Haliotis rufescens]|uniref:lysophosphatidic acid receptor 1-B-like n=1 Tax=Haliotis rufescens TaxID=6454 RepID=UPI001EB01DF4|nr:lysophosphatidic acid receptor 1-B-like [Haliotis rufescens]